MSVLKYLPESWKERVRARAGAVTVAARLRNLRRAGFSPRQIIDGGAYRGEWAALARDVFPESELLLVEPQPSLTPLLEATCSRLTRARLASIALDRLLGESTFLLGESNSYLVAGDASRGPTIRVPVTTLAELIESQGWHACDLLKLDVQGRELDVLAGAGDWFGRIEVLVLEVSWLRIGHVPLVTEVVEACSKRGYVPYDVFGLNHRPLDGALWQSDIVFVRRDSPLVSSLAWN